MKFTKLANFQDKQKEAWYTLLDPICKYLLFGGAAGGGKSYMLRWVAVGLAMYYYRKYGITGIPIGLFSEDYPTLRDRQVTKIKREFPEWLGDLKETQTEGLGFYLAPEYGSGIILLRNLDDPSKYASVEFAAILVEELTKNKYETFEDLRNRMRFPGISERKFVAATNPGEIGHGWVKRLFVTPDKQFPDIEQDRFRFIRSLVTDNKYNPDDYILQLKAIRDPQKRKALLEGDWNQFKGMYFEEWRDILHTITPFVPNPKASVIVGGFDWGRTKPFSFHLASITKEYHDESSFFRARTMFELYNTNMLPSEISIEIKRKLLRINMTLDDISWVRCDPKIFSKQDDGSKSIRDQFVDEDERWRTILQPGNNDRISGWSIIHDWLSIAPDGLPYWQITTNNDNLIRTLPELIHDENMVEDVNTEGEDHAADDSRYMFKHLKWIDAKAGAVKENRALRTNKSQIFMPMNDQGQQIAINLDRFRK